MKRAAAYFGAQGKRALRLLPMQTGISLLIWGCVGLAVFLLVSQKAAEGQDRYRIGLVGDVSDSYLGFGFATLQTMDDSRLMIELVQMEEAEAKEALSRGELTAVMRVPEGFVDSVVNGDNDTRVTYETVQGQKDLSSMVMGEIAEAASTLVTASQSAIYGMQRTLYEQEGADLIGRETDRLNLMLINFVLSRSGFSEVEVLGYADGLSLEAYYFCRIVLLMLLLAGLSGGVFFLGRKTALAGMLKAGGVGAFSQIVGEYLAYLGYLCAGFVLPLCCLALILERGAFPLPEWEGMGAEGLLALLPYFFAAAAMFAAFQLFLCEVADGMVNGILLQLICGVGMGYLAGYFYPAAFFPDRLQSVGAFLPTGSAARFVESGFLSESAHGAGMAVWAWLAVFLLLAAAVRRGRILRG